MCCVYSALMRHLSTAVMQQRREAKILFNFKSEEYSKRHAGMFSAVCSIAKLEAAHYGSNKW